MMTESFGLLFLLSRRFEYITDQVLKKDNLTTKQLLVLIAIQGGFQSSPSISEVADLLSTSHQNVKQIAQQLEKKDFVGMVRDEKDRRRWILRLTKKNQEYWDSRFQEHVMAMKSLFKSLNSKEIQALHSIFVKLAEDSLIGFKEAKSE